MLQWRGSTLSSFSPFPLRRVEQFQSLWCVPTPVGCRDGVGRAALSGAALWLRGSSDSARPAQLLPRRVLRRDPCRAGGFYRCLCHRVLSSLARGCQAAGSYKTAGIAGCCWRWLKCSVWVEAAGRAAARSLDCVSEGDAAPQQRSLQEHGSHPGQCWSGDPALCSTKRPNKTRT